MDQEFIDAAKSSRAERMRELGNHVDVSGSVGGAAARITARNGDVRALRWLAAAGAPLAAADDARGETALHTAVWNGHVQVARLLRAWASERDDGGAALAALVARDLRGETPLHVAARRGELACARCLVDECGIAADVTAREWPHATPAALVPRQCEGGEELRAFLAARSREALARREHERETNLASETTCAICLEELGSATADDDDAALTKALVCGHRFHTACIATWRQRSDACPCCKQLVVDGAAAAGGGGAVAAAALRRRRAAAARERRAPPPQTSAYLLRSVELGLPPRTMPGEVLCDDHHTRTPGVADDLGGGIACSSSSPFL